MRGALRRVERTARLCVPKMQRSPRPPLGAPRKLLSPEEIIEREIDFLRIAYRDATLRVWQGAIMRGIAQRALALATMRETGT